MPLQVFKMFASRSDLKIMVIGATGAGKSSLINLFYVWSQNVTSSQLGKLKNVLIKTSYLGGDGSTENLKAGQRESVTTMAKSYYFELHDKERNVKYNLTFLDTPGLGDTRGIEKDEENISTIIDQVVKTENLNAILLMVNGTDPRINTRVKYVLTKLQGILPTVFLQNLFILMSNVDLKPNLKITNEDGIEVEKSKIMSYQNQIFTLQPDDYADEDIMTKVGQSYDKSIRVLSKLLSEMSKCIFKPTSDFQKLKTDRDLLKRTLNNLNLAESQIHKKKDELQKFVEEISNENYEISNLNTRLNDMVDQENWRSRPTSFHNTLCLSCHKCCHYNCGLQKTTSQGSSIFQTCAAFNGSTNCKECGHHYQSHVHLMETQEREFIKVPKININIKNQIDDKKGNISKKQEAITKAKAEILRYQKQLEKISLQVEKITLGLRQVCSKFDYVRQIQACINVLKENIETLTAEASFGKDSQAIRKVNSLKETKKSMEALMVKIQNCSSSKKK